MNWSRKSAFRPLLSLGLLVLISISVLAQNPKRIEKQAVENFNQGNFVDARDQFIKLFDAGWNYNITASYLASCYLELDKPQKSFEVLSQVEEPDQVNSYLMILTQYYLEKFDEAERLISEFRDTTGFEIDVLKERIARAEEKYQTNNGILVQNFGDGVNSEDMEYSAIMYNGYNELLFTSRKEEGAVTDVDGLAFENIYYTHLDSSDNWEKATPFNIEVKKSRSHDATVQFLESSQKMILYHDGQLYSATKKNGVWSRDEDLILHEVNGGDTHCYLSPDEKSIIFASDYASGGEHLDLFISYKNDEGAWSEPQPIIELNTDMDEDSPFIAGDSVLYFSSNGHNSMGGYDVYRTRYDTKMDKWGTPENMGYPINTVADDIYYTTEGKLAYLSSNRLGGKGSLDLYRVFLFNRVKVEGRLLTDNQEPISNAEINIKYENTSLKSFTDEEGNYDLFVPINTRMHITFIKDSLNLVEGDYIANISFKDQNNNEFNFFIDYVDQRSELVDGNKDDQFVRNLNIQVKNDYEDNPILASVPEGEERLWTDSVNYVAQRKRAEILNPETTIATRSNDHKTEMRSGSLNIHEATIIEKPKPDPPQTVKADNGQLHVDGYTVQILAMPIKRPPDSTFFDKLDSTPVKNKDGKDGLKRFHVGNYKSKEEALEAMRILRRSGYSDAFVRKLDMYAEL